MKFIRRALFWVLNPRPPWWASGWTWGVVAALALGISLREGPHHTVSMQGALTVYRTVTGFEVSDSFPPPVGQKVVLTVNFRVVEGTDYLRLDAPWPKLISATPANPPVTESEIREIAVLAGKRYSGEYGDREPGRGHNLWARGQTSELQRGAVSWFYEVISWLGYFTLGLVAIVSYLRMVQTKWYNKQLVRLDKGQCPSCEYDLSGTGTGSCPECGCNPLVARREATKALGLG